MSSIAMGHREHGPAALVVAVAVLAALGGGAAPGALNWRPSATLGLLATGLPLGGAEQPFLHLPDALCRVVPTTAATGAAVGAVRAAYPKLAITAIERHAQGSRSSGWILLCPARSSASRQ
ncbi:hypothetical protein [Naasia aerilata]|uniref:Uncharacterized protein n=1 Tax=Naasia aerilata TaxID=1162966 RepID=A0ABM8GFR4_9MICO|nr:hypothetical protein [Naasia aerilata]BDZ46923.1 hypothetical protein GCM10025866_28320 [Naasia aerilata]